MEVNDLLKIKEKMDNLEKDIAKDEGVLEQLMNDLNELGFSSVKKANKEIKRLTELIEEKEEQLTNDMKILEEKMEDWDDL